MGFEGLLGNEQLKENLRKGVGAWPYFPFLSDFRPGRFGQKDPCPSFGGGGIVPWGE